MTGARGKMNDDGFYFYLKEKERMKNSAALFLCFRPIERIDFGAFRFAPVLRMSPVCSSRFSLPAKAQVVLLLAGQAGLQEEVGEVICGWT